MRDETWLTLDQIEQLKQSEERRIDMLPPYIPDPIIFNSATKQIHTPTGKAPTTTPNRYKTRKKKSR